MFVNTAFPLSKRLKMRAIDETPEPYIIVPRMPTGLPSAAGRVYLAGVPIRPIRLTAADQDGARVAASTAPDLPLPRAGS